MTSGTKGGSFTATPTITAQSFDALLDKHLTVTQQRNIARTAAVTLEQEVAAYLPVVRHAAHVICWDAEQYGQPYQDPSHPTPCAHCQAREALSRFDL